MKTKHLVWSALAAAQTIALPMAARAGDETQQSKQVVTTDDKPAPLPLHEIEGNGGIFSTLSAYLVDPPRNNEPIGRPSIGGEYVDLGHGRDLEALTITETPWNRLELGYGYNRFALGDLPLALEKAGLNIKEDNVQLHNFNARLSLLKEGEFGADWLPAVTFGVHYKVNTTISNINTELDGALRGIGITDDSGVDYTLYATKLIKSLPLPVLVNLGVRETKAAEIGLFGFTDHYSAHAEGSIGVFLTNKLILAGEYRSQPSDYKAIPGLIKTENDWWTIDLAYVVNNNLTLAVGYGHFGDVLNDQANSVWGVTIKNEF